MNAPTFILGLRERGATLQIEGGRLRVTPSTVLTDADRAAWREHKREIIALLEMTSQTGAQPQSSTRTVTTPGVTRNDWRASPREFEPRALYNSQAARVFVERDQTLLPEQRAALLQYAAQSRCESQCETGEMPREIKESNGVAPFVLIISSYFK